MYTSLLYHSFGIREVTHLSTKYEKEETTIDASLSTGRPLGNDSFINEAEAMSGKCLVKMKSGWTKGKARKKK
jgi:hypothetical protein